MNNRLWYKQPATYWEEALPIGNGKIGAMVYGGVETEQYQLNEDTIWSGPGEDNFKKETPELIEKTRQLIREQRFSEAHNFLKEEVLPKNDECQSYQTGGNYYFDFQVPEGDISHYVRELNLAEAINKTVFSVGDDPKITFTRNAFISFREKVICIKFTTTQKGSLSFKTRYDSPMPEYEQESISNTAIMVKGRCHNMNPNFVNGNDDDKQVFNEDARRIPSIRYQITMKANVQGEDASCRSNADGNLVISNADSVEIYLTIISNFDGWENAPGSKGRDIKQESIDRLDAALAKGYETVQRDHIHDHAKLYNTLSLDLKGNERDQPTDVRLLKNRPPEEVPGLIELLFNHGRYLLITSSRPGSEPANLQGIWNDLVSPRWGSRYTININTEMNYWPAQVCNLAECEWPYLDMLEELSISGRRIAKELYNCRGWCSHHNTDLWRWASIVQWKPQHAFWPMSGGWIARNIMEYYRFSGDVDYLREKGFSILKGASLFFLDFIVEDSDGKLSISPSTSPENLFIDPETGDTSAVCQGSTVDIAIVKEVFKDTLEAADILGIEDDDTCKEINEATPQLADYKIGSKGQLLEFSDDFDEYEPKHRHVSHLFNTIYPGSEFTPSKNKERFDAARKSLDIRGDKTTGWGMGWRVALWARFLDGERSLSVIGNLLRPIVLTGDEKKRGGTGDGGVYMNLFDAHPPFQIDGNFGVTAGIAEMLIQSHRESINILPALPFVWKGGCVKGLRARGGFEVDITWENGVLTSLKVTSFLGNPLNITYNDHTATLLTEKGTSYEFDGHLERV